MTQTHPATPTIRKLLLGGAYLMFLIGVLSFIRNALYLTVSLLNVDISLGKWFFTMVFSFNIALVPVVIGLILHYLSEYGSNSEEGGRRE